MLITWKEKYVIDEGVIDDDHRFLIHALNLAIEEVRRQAPACSLLKQVLHIKGFAALHFKREEKLQEWSKYPCRHAHCREHGELLARLDEVIAELSAASGDEPYPDQDNIKSFFYRWMLSHIIDSDQKLKPFLATISTADEKPLRLMARS